MQIVYSNRAGKRDLEHIGSAHTDAELEALKVAARQRIAAGQPELDLGLQARPVGGGPLPITAARMGPLLDALDPQLKTLGWEPHRYDWRLSQDDRREIDERAEGSWLWREHGATWGAPSLMEDDPHACLMAGFARWCDQLLEDGMVIA